LLEKGEKIVQETRGWDDAKQRTFSQRSKEDAHDYRYFPDPDLPPIELDDELIEAVCSEMPVMPDVWRERLQGFGLDEAQIATLLEGEIELPQVKYLPLIAEVSENTAFAKVLANWFVNFELPLRHDESVAVSEHVTNQSRLHMYQAVNELIEANKLSSSNAKVLFTKVLTSADPVTDIAAFAAQHGLVQESDEGAIKAIVEAVLAANPKAAEDVKNGEMKAIGFLVGQVMKQSQGRANPQLAQKLIKECLGI